MSDPVPPRRRVTGQDVADATGVSRATVSYVLNDNPNKSITEDVRTRVREAALRLGYSPYAPARALRSGRSQIVLVVVPRLSMGYEFNRELEHMDFALAQRGLVLLIHRHTSSVRPFRQLLAAIAPAVVVSMATLTAADRTEILATTPRLIDVAEVLSNEEIGRMQVRYLAQQGHSRLGYAYPRDELLDEFAAPRLEGARRECASLGLPAPVVIRSSFDRREATAALEEWRAHPAGITAICAHNDDIAMALVAAGAAIGDDERARAVIGVDDVPLAEFGLTTIAIDSIALAQYLVDSVLAVIDGTEEPVAPGRLLRLLPRDSA